MAAKKRSRKSPKRRRKAHAKKKGPSVVNLAHRVTNIERKLNITRKRKRSAAQKKQEVIDRAMGFGSKGY